MDLFDEPPALDPGDPYEPPPRPNPVPLPRSGVTDDRTAQQLDTVVRLLVENYEQTVRLAQIAARDSAVRTAAAQRAGLVGEVEPPGFRWEAALGAVFAGVAGLVPKVIPEGFGEFVRRAVARLAPEAGITPLTAGALGAAALGGAAVAILAGIKRWRYHRERADRRLVVDALRQVEELYTIHSGGCGRLQWGAHLRVQVQALLGFHAGMTWEEVAAADGTAAVRTHLDRLAAIETARALDLVAYARAGGESWLELLQAGLRGEIPPVLCLYAAAGMDGTAHGPSLREWRQVARRLCRAERAVCAANSPRKERGYRALQPHLGRVTAFSAATLFDLLEEWSGATGVVGLRRGQHLSAFEAAFRPWR